MLSLQNSSAQAPGLQESEVQVCAHQFPHSVHSFSQKGMVKGKGGRGNGEGEPCGNKPGENSIQIRKLALPFLSVAFQLKYSSVPGIECD